MKVDAQRFESFLAGHFKGLPINGGLDAKLKTLELDSLDLLDFILAMENALGVTVDVDSIDDDMTLREIHERLVAPKP